MVRVAHSKALPTDAQIAESGHADAYEFVTHLKTNDLLQYELFVAEADGEWWHAPRQPIGDAVRHLLCLMRKTTEDRLGRLERGASATAQPKAPAARRGGPSAKASASSTAGAQGVGESACAVDLAAVETFGVALARSIQIQDDAAEVISRHSRGALARIQLKLQKRSAWHIQRRIRRRSGWNKLLCLRPAALVIGAYYRGWRTRVILQAHRSHQRNARKAAHAERATRLHGTRALVRKAAASQPQPLCGSSSAGAQVKAFTPPIPERSSFTIALPRGKRVQRS